MNFNAELTSLEALALSKTKIADKQRGECPTGTHEVDFLVRVRGQVTIGEDYEQTVSPAVPWRDMLLVALSQMAPAHREAFVRGFLESGMPADVKTDDLKDEVESLAAGILETTRKTCRGKTSAKLSLQTTQVVADAA